MSSHCLLLEEGGESLQYLFRRHVFLAGCVESNVTERIFQFAVAIAVELVRHRLQYFIGAGVGLGQRPRPRLRRKGESSQVFRRAIWGRDDLIQDTRQPSIITARPTLISACPIFPLGSISR